MLYLLLPFLEDIFYFFRDFAIRVIVPPPFIAGLIRILHNIIKECYKYIIIKQNNNNNNGSYL